MSSSASADTGTGPGKIQICFRVCTIVQKLSTIVLFVATSCICPVHLVKALMCIFSFNRCHGIEKLSDFARHISSRGDVVIKDMDLRRRAISQVCV